MNQPKRKRLPALASQQELERFKAQLQALPTIGQAAKDAVMASMTAAMNPEPETAENVIASLDPEDRLRVTSAAMTYQRTLSGMNRRGKQALLLMTDEEFNRRLGDET